MHERPQRHNSNVLSVLHESFRYGDTWGGWHGGSGGNQLLIEPPADDPIVSVEATVEDRVYSVTFVTRSGRVYGPHGATNRGYPIVTRARPCKPGYVEGYAGGNYFDMIGMHWEC